MSNDRRLINVAIATVAVAWAVFQLLLPRFIILDTITVRLIHLAFAVALALLVSLDRKSLPKNKKPPSRPLAVIRVVAMGAIIVSILYLIIDKDGIASRAGLPLVRDIVFSALLITILIYITQLAIGIWLPLIAVFFSLAVFFGEQLPTFLAFRSASVAKYVNQIALSTEGILGIPLDVSANTVFLFVLFGSLLSRSGTSLFFNDSATALFGRFRGGPAKTAVVASGLTGLISGSSIANVVTTGTFTIPLMKKVGYPSKIAAATEVAASTNGQLMPPIMGAAAFIIAEYLGLAYVEVIKAAIIPAFVSYIALFYITHLEALRYNLKGLSKSQIPPFFGTLKRGAYHLIPIMVLITDLFVFRRSPKFAAFDAIVTLVVVQTVRALIVAARRGERARVYLRSTFQEILQGCIEGGKNMVTVALATATAGIVVGTVNMGIGSIIVQIVEILSAGNFFLLLVITAVASLVLGMGLPTTATYIVMASITVPIIVQVGGSFGVLLPAIAAHLFCFYFGILADDTPPVGLAAYAASAIAESPPIATGIKGFVYDLRTAVIPFMFIFNSELLLQGIDSFWHSMLIFAAATIGALSFTSAVQGWGIRKNRWFEIPLFLIASALLFLPAHGAQVLGIDFELRYICYALGAALFASTLFVQRLRKPLHN